VVDGWYGACFAGFGIAKLIFSVYGGILVDRFTARRLFPYFVIPAFLGFLALAFIFHKISPMIFLPMLGITMGVSGVVTSAVIAEIYGVDKIGKIRSLFTVLMVVGAAIGPILYGALLDAGITFTHIAAASSIALIFIFASSTQLEK